MGGRPSPARKDPARRSHRPVAPRRARGVRHCHASRASAPRAGRLLRDGHRSPPGDAALAYLRSIAGRHPPPAQAAPARGLAGRGGPRRIPGRPLPPPTHAASWAAPCWRPAPLRRSRGRLHEPGRSRSRRPHAPGSEAVRVTGPATHAGSALRRSARRRSRPGDGRGWPRTARLPWEKVRASTLSGSRKSMTGGGPSAAREPSVSRPPLVAGAG